MLKKKWQIFVPADFESTPYEYMIGGKKYPRVTTTLGVVSKHRIDNWKKSIGYAQAAKILETRQAIGIHIHKLIELTLKKEDYNLGTYETEIQEGLCKFYEFNKVAELVPEALEQRLWSNEHNYAGTADYIGYYRNPDKRFLVRGHEPKFTKKAFVIGDWKTAKAFYPSYWCQLAAYAMAFKELTGIQVEGGFVCRIRDGKLKVKEMTWDEMVKSFEVYKAVLTVYHFRMRGLI